MSPSRLIVVAEPAVPAGPTGEALHRALYDAEHRSLRELALRLLRTDEHRLPEVPVSRDA